MFPGVEVCIFLSLLQAGAEDTRPAVPPQGAFLTLEPLSQHPADGVWNSGAPYFPDQSSPRGKGSRRRGFPGGGDCPGCYEGPFGLRRGTCLGDWMCSPCDMHLRYEYFPTDHGNYYFRPYSAMRLAQHRQAVFGEPVNPAIPYDHLTIDRVYEQLQRERAARRQEAAEETTVPAEDEPLDSAPDPDPELQSRFGPPQPTSLGSASLLNLRYRPDWLLWPAGPGTSSRSGRAGSAAIDPVHASDLQAPKLSLPDRVRRAAASTGDQ